MKTLSLFNSVVCKPDTSTLFVSSEGFIIESGALWAKDRIISFYKSQKLSGNDLNKTFHKSWQVVRESSREELVTQQILHYLSTYGSNFRDEVYIPSEELEVPDVKLTYKVIKAISKEEMTQKCLDMLRSGVALKEETIDTILSVLTDELQYSFTGDEGIKNKEAIIKIADLYNVIPKDTMEFFRYIIYRATGESLLIKNQKAITAIQCSSFNPGVQFEKHGVKKLAEIFNRFKPLFLAFKSKCPSIINRISKASKVFHKPLVVNALMEATQRELGPDDSHWLKNATPFALFKAISAIKTRLRGQTSFNYRIRNGKSWCKESNKPDTTVMVKNYLFILNHIKSRFNLLGVKVFIPDGIEYGLPTSEKMFVGNIPTGTKFYGDQLAVGIYWENDWGAYDWDLSGSPINGDKVGWNSRFSDNTLTFSGDITNAPSGAVEYVHCLKGLKTSYLINNNLFRGNKEIAGYKIIIGSGPEVSKKYMMDPNKVMAEIKTENIQSQMVIGLLLPEGKRQSFTLLNFGSGNIRVSGKANNLQAITEQYSNPFSFNDLLKELGVQLTTKENADYSFDVNDLDRDSFLKLFKKAD